MNGIGDMNGDRGNVSVEMDLAVFEGGFEGSDQFVFDEDSGTVRVFGDDGVTRLEPEPALIEVAGFVERLE